ncbi:caspase family protein [Flammeovirga sp. SJP92]|uniref:caspase family protein n=1 Tax=Flammeovirga sp. SJP92 TaxID=1775430 RepID=UPI00078769BF|nr:caspase family protein [Flammeovirga sp. SJP92]KXX66574.1 hypothetical protein AVL50_31250 [Flammeovirga sp. SJP92]
MKYLLLLFFLPSCFVQAQQSITKQLPTDKTYEIKGTVGNHLLLSDFKNIILLDNDLVVSNHNTKGKDIKDIFIHPHHPHFAFNHYSDNGYKFGIYDKENEKDIDIPFLINKDTDYEFIGFLPFKPWALIFSQSKNKGFIYDYTAQKFISIFSRKNKTLSVFDLCKSISVHLNDHEYLLLDILNNSNNFNRHLDYEVIEENSNPKYIKGKNNKKYSIDQGNILCERDTILQLPNQSGFTLISDVEIENNRVWGKTHNNLFFSFVLPSLSTNSNQEYSSFNYSIKGENNEDFEIVDLRNQPIPFLNAEKEQLALMDTTFFDPEDPEYFYIDVDEKEEQILLTQNSNYSSIPLNYIGLSLFNLSSSTLQQEYTLLENTYKLATGFTFLDGPRLYFMRMSYYNDKILGYFYEENGEVKEIAKNNFEQAYLKQKKGRFITYHFAESLPGMGKLVLNNLNYPSSFLEPIVKQVNNDYLIDNNSYQYVPDEELFIFTKKTNNKTSSIYLYDLNTKRNNKASLITKIDYPKNIFDFKYINSTLYLSLQNGVVQKMKINEWINKNINDTKKFDESQLDISIKKWGEKNIIGFDYHKEKNLLASFYENEGISIWDLSTNQQVSYGKYVGLENINEKPITWFEVAPQYFKASENDKLEINNDIISTYTPYVMPPQEKVNMISSLESHLKGINFFESFYLQGIKKSNVDGCCWGDHPKIIFQNSRYKIGYRETDVPFKSLDLIDLKTNEITANLHHHQARHGYWYKTDLGYFLSDKGNISEVTTLYQVDNKLFVGRNNLIENEISVWNLDAKLLQNNFKPSSETSVTKWVHELKWHNNALYVTLGGGGYARRIDFKNETFSIDTLTSKVLPDYPIREKFEDYFISNNEIFLIERPAQTLKRKDLVTGNTREIFRLGKNRRFSEILYHEDSQTIYAVGYDNMGSFNKKDYKVFLWQYDLKNNKSEFIKWFEHPLYNFQLKDSTLFFTKKNEEHFYIYDINRKEINFLKENQYSILEKVVVKYNGLFFKYQVPGIFGISPIIIEDHYLYKMRRDYIQKIDLTGTPNRFNKLPVIENYFIGDPPSIIEKIDEKNFIFGYPTGEIAFYTLENGLTKKGSLYIGEESGFMMFSPDKYYFTSPNMNKSFSVMVDQIPYSSEQFDIQLNRPDKVLEKIPFVTQKTVDYYKELHQIRMKWLGIEETDFKISLPKIELSSLPDNVDNDRLKLSLRASSASTLNHLNIWVNNVPVFGREGKKLNNQKDWNGSIEIELSQGKNLIEVSVTDALNNESLRKSQTVYANKNNYSPKYYFIALGVSKHQNQLYNLKYADKDALDFTSTLEKVIKKDGVEIISKTFTNQEVTTSVVNEVEAILKTAKVDDHVYVFYAGHGVLENQKLYLSSYPIDFSKPSAQGLSFEALEEVVNNCPARQKVMFVDACHSGELFDEQYTFADSSLHPQNTRGLKVLNRKNTKDNLSKIKAVFQETRRQNGTFIFSSASGLEFAYENKNWQNGVFTYSLLSGITSKEMDINRDQTINMWELKEYLFQKVDQLTEGKQHPTSRSENLANDFIFVELNPL